MNRKFYNLLGLARRAGRVALGAHAVEKSLKNNKAFLVFFAEDVADNTRESVLQHIGKRQFFISGTKQTWGEYFGRKELGVFAILNPNFARGLLEELGDLTPNPQPEASEPEPLASHVSKDKIRKRALAARRKLSRDVRRGASRRIAKDLLGSEIYQNAKIIHCYISLPEEVDTRFIISRALKEGKKVIVPKTKAISGGLDHFNLSSLDHLVPGAFGILEPDPDKCKKLTKAEPDLVIVPGVSFDKKGNRIGFGKGYYDRFLSETSGIKIGLAFSVQMVRKAAAETHDVRMHRVFTENEMITVAK